MAQATAEPPASASRCARRKPRAGLLHGGRLVSIGGSGRERWSETSPSPPTHPSYADRRVAAMVLNGRVASTSPGEPEPEHREQAIGRLDGDGPRAGGEPPRARRGQRRTPRPGRTGTSLWRGSPGGAARTGSHAAGPACAAGSSVGRPRRSRIVVCRHGRPDLVGTPRRSSSRAIARSDIPAAFSSRTRPTAAASAASGSRVRPSPARRTAVWHLAGPLAAGPLGGQHRLHPRLDDQPLILGERIHDPPEQGVSQASRRPCPPPPPRQRAPYGP